MEVALVTPLSTTVAIGSIFLGNTFMYKKKDVKITDSDVIYYKPMVVVNIINHLIITRQSNITVLNNSVDRL